MSREPHADSFAPHETVEAPAPTTTITTKPPRMAAPPFGCWPARCC